MIDIHGAEWLSADSYRLVDSAEQYEQYECSFAAKVGQQHHWQLLLPCAADICRSGQYCV
jgi:hypothetical protein